ncbi:MAG: ABC transporter ATP-binding protein [Coprobacillaceae bacterium]
MKSHTITKLLSFCKPYYKQLLFLVLISIGSVVCTLLTPVILGEAIDLLVNPNQINVDSLISQLSMVAIVVGIGALSQWILSRITNYITYHITTDLRNQIFDKLQVLPLQYMDNHLHGDLVSRIVNDVDLIGVGLLQSFTSLFTGIITILGTIIIMCLINTTIAIIVIVLTPLSLVISSYIAKKTYIYFQEQLALRGKMNAYIEERIGNQKLIQAFTYEKQNLKNFDKINQEMHISGVKSQFLGALINPTTRVINSFVYAAVGIFGAMRVVQGHFTVGLLSSFLTYANQYTKPINEISSVITEMQTALAASKRVFDVLEEDEEQAVLQSKTISDFKGTVKLKDVSFSYVPEKPFIKDLNVIAKAGKIVAIVGRTGCGKTTLINLLMRFYEQSGGHIEIDDVDILNMDRNYLRGLYGMVLQDTWLFTGTIKENIAYGKDGASDEEVIEAAQKARIHKFIMTLPDGYETVVSEENGNISLGQKQLLCIARVMLRKPPMLILDEATSSIDTRTELQIQGAFDALMKDKTTFIVAHRLSTIKNADQILVMDKGKIIEQGTHQQLLNKHGYYYDLYYSQFHVS